MDLNPQLLHWRTAALTSQPQLHGVRQQSEESTPVVFLLTLEAICTMFWWAEHHKTWQIFRSSVNMLKYKNPDLGIAIWLALPLILSEPMWLSPRLDICVVWIALGLSSLLEVLF